MRLYCTTDPLKVYNVLFSRVAGDTIVTFASVVDAVSYVMFSNNPGSGANVTTTSYDYTFPVTDGQNFGVTTETYVIIVAVFADASLGTPSDVYHDEGP